MQIIFFEDEKIESLYPITLARPGFDILCAGLTLYDLIKRQFKPVRINFIVRDYLTRVADQKYKQKFSRVENNILFLNSRLVPDFLTGKDLIKELSGRQNIIFKSKNQIVGAWVNLSDVRVSPTEIKQLKTFEVVDFLQRLKLKPKKVDWLIFNHLWEVITLNQDLLLSNLKLIQTNFKQYQEKVFIGKKVEIAEQVVFDTRQGLIVINDGVEISPFCHLIGPLYIGKNCKIKSFSYLQDNCCIGDVCKVGGEVEASVIQGYSNKQHFGFLGHSYVGEWVNVGAGSSNSDLKNTYSSIKMNSQDTGRQFLGCVIGDYSKAAINTSIFTGKVIGVSSFLYGTVGVDVPSFTNFAGPAGGKVEFLIEAAIKSQKAMFGRRKIKQTTAHIKLLKDIYGQTEADRKQGGVGPGKLIFK